MIQANVVALFSGVFMLFGLVVGGVGGWLVHSAVGEYLRSARRDEFEPVQARVLRSELNEGADHRVDRKVLPVVEYEYTVGGETYTSDSVWPGEDMSGTDREKRQAIVDRYSAGEVVEAYYDPEDPTVTFLENKSQTTKSAMLVIFGVVFVLAGLGTIGFGALLGFSGL